MTEQEQIIYQPLLEIEDVLPILGQISILAGLTQEQQHSLFRLLEKTTYKKGQTIFRQGHQPTHIYIIKSGAVQLIVSQDDTPFELVVFHQGQCFGEASVIGILPHAATAFAMEDTEVIVLSRETLMNLYDDDIKLFSILILNIARESCRRLHSSSETLLHYFMNK